MSNSWNGSLASPEMTSSNDGLADVGDCSADLRTSRTVPGNCGGCGRAIVDRYFLQAAGRSWHVGGCLRCVSCLASLDFNRSCFVRAGLIYCCADYHRTSTLVDDEDSTCRSLSSSRCSGCRQTFGAGDLVMRTPLSIFHSSCFSCCVCRRRLSRGQQFALADTGRIYCRADYERRRAAADSTAADTGVPSARLDSDRLRSDEVKIDPCQSASTDDEELPSSVAVVKTHCRTRKTMSSVHQDTTDMNGDGAETRQRFSVGEEYCNNGSDGAVPRPKRLRTSFKHYQLRALKTYFALNHNPDAKDLKQLSQKTALGKRILQVWFQNARAKYRRCLQRGNHTADEQRLPPSTLSVTTSPPPPPQQPLSVSPSCCNTGTATSSVRSSSSPASSDLQLTTGSSSD